MAENDLLLKDVLPDKPFEDMGLKEDLFDIVYVINTSTGPVDVCEELSTANRVKSYFIEQGFVDVRILTFRLRHG